MVAIGWVDTDALDDLWPASTQLEMADLTTLLQSSYLACAAYAPPMPLAPAADGSGALVPTVPESWKLAQVMHAKHLWARFRSGNADTIGPDGYTISTYPMVLEARALLRPVRPAYKMLR